MTTNVTNPWLLGDCVVVMFKYSNRWYSSITSLWLKNVLTFAFGSLQMWLTNETGPRSSFSKEGFDDRFITDTRAIFLSISVFLMEATNPSQAISSPGLLKSWNAKQILSDSAGTILCTRDGLLDRNINYTYCSIKRLGSIFAFSLSKQLPIFVKKRIPIFVWK